MDYIYSTLHYALSHAFSYKTRSSRYYQLLCFRKVADAFQTVCRVLLGLDESVNMTHELGHDTLLNLRGSVLHLLQSGETCQPRAHHQVQFAYSLDFGTFQLGLCTKDTLLARARHGRHFRL